MTAIDIAIFSWINLGPLAPDWVFSLARFASLELPRCFVVGSIAVLLAGRPPWREQAMRAVLAMAVAALVAYLLKYVANVPRPFMLGIGHAWLAHAGTPGFPSAHSSVAFAFGICAALTRGTHWSVRTIFMLLAGLVAWSRVALGLHFPSDVVAGALVGALGAACAAAVTIRFSRVGRHRPREGHGMLKKLRARS